MFDKRITLFMGHYGSGKTFISVNYAIALAKMGKKVSIYDLDIVNPYFRTIDAKKTLEKENVELVVSPYAQTNVDLPAMNAKAYQMLDDKTRYAVADIGGDDRGALALGRFYERIKQEDNYDSLFVINKYRPETRDIEGAIEIMNEIEYASKIKFTGIVSNSNLGKETTIETILSGVEFAKELSNKLNLPLKFTGVLRQLSNDEQIKKIKEILPIDPIKYGDWI